MLPSWPPGTVAVLVTQGPDPHAIPVSACIRADARTAFVGLAAGRSSLARLREDPRVALAVMAGGDVAVTAYGRAVVADEAVVEGVAAVRVEVERVQDHGRPTFAIEAGVQWRWVDAGARERDAEVREALARLAARASSDGEVRAAVGTHRPIEFREAFVDSGDGARLERAMRAEMAELYDGLALDGPSMPKAGPAELNPPSGRFLVGYDAAGEPVCCGGLKRLDETACELKRMYVVPSHRGRGVARALLAELERIARELGYRVARLDTGPRQAGAQRLYESSGYRPVGNFNANPVASFFGEKPL